jgi:uncharacterized protein (TIGR02594 family)
MFPDLRSISLTLYQVAQRFVGMKEIAGEKDNGFIVWAHSLVGLPDADDETPWCASWLNGLCFILGLPMSNSAAARSWLNVGVPVDLDDAIPGFDVVILQRGSGPQPGPDVTSGAPGHVGLFAGLQGDVPNHYVLILGGNQADQVSIARFPRDQVLGVRRLHG